MSGSFIDTNVLVYIAGKNPAKADRTEALLAAGGTISVQVLNEFASVARRKMDFSFTEIRDFLGSVRRFVEVTPVNVETHAIGMELASRHNFSIYDSMIVAAALQAECDILHSEDMQHGRVIDGLLTISNPFL